MNAAGYLRMPSISGSTIVFVTEDDLWSVDAGGGIARRLTASPSECTLPRLSPDGRHIAYVSRDEGHPEVSVIPAAGGPARRVTFLGSDALYVCGWSSDSQTIFFTSDSGAPFVKETLAFTVSLDGGVPTALPWGHAMTFAIGAGGATAIGRNNIDPARWKRYRGGTAGQIWVDPHGNGAFARIDRALNGNCVWPMWMGRRVAFLSDHEGIGNIYSCAPDGSDLRRHTNETEFYVRHPATDGERIVYACGGEIVVLDLRDESVQRIAIETPSSAPQTARRFIDASDHLESFAPSPDGTNVALVSRGHVFTMPLWEAAVSEIGGDTTARRRAAAWLPDGERIASIDDSAGYERITIARVDQTTEPEFVTDANFGRITELVAAPFGDRLAFANHRHEVYLFDLGGTPRLIDTGVAWRCIDLAFSPDGRWLAYVWFPKSETSIVRIASCDDGAVHDATTALRVDRSPSWDPDGNYLYFISTRDFNPVYDALQFDLSFPHATRPYVATLRRDVANPFVAKPAPLHRAKDDEDDESDEDETTKDKDKPKAPKPIAIDFDGLPQRMLAFPVEEAQYDRVAGAKGRAVFSRFPVEGAHQAHRSSDDEPGGSLHAYEFETQRSGTLASDIDEFVVGNDGRTLVYTSRDKMRVLDAGADLPDDEPEDKPAGEMSRRSGWLDLGRISVQIDPRTEWLQMYREAWRLQREQFWDPGMSGVDWDAVRVRYEPLVERVRTRAELSDVIWEMQGELGTSHAYEMGGDVRIWPQYRRGFLGADLAWDETRGGYRIERILRGDSWNRNEDSPLAEPGLDVREGDTIVAIGGHAATPMRTPGSLLVNLAGRDVTLTIDRDGTHKRVLVRTLRDERMLRYRAWVERNRELVHDRTSGRVGYVHIPDMGPWGFAEFHRGYLSEFDREGLIVDVRYNRGGHVSPLLLEKLARKRVGYDVSRYGPPKPYPPESVGGAMVAITNQFAGSDGDIFSHCFKLYGLGPLVGMRTWGGVIGINPYHALVDGTLTTQPEYSFWFVDAGWGVENYGTDPDIEVDIAPQDSAAGKDPQMETALRLMDEALLQQPPAPAFAPFPNRAHRRTGVDPA